MTKKILLFTGDPNSINSEIIFKSWKTLNSSIKKKIYFISNYDLIKDQFKKLKYSVEIKNVKGIDELAHSDKIKIINIDLNFSNSFKVSTNNRARFIQKALNYCHNLSLNKRVIGLINCPIDKRLLKKKEIGVTEFLANKCQIKKNSEVMLITNEKFSVSPITTHVDLKKVSNKISKEIIINKIKTISFWFKKFKNKKPKICLLGLNPHNSELKKNSEEKKIIIPAIKKLKQLGTNIKGPYPADTIFINNYKHFDIIVGMYHDQVITPFKTLYKFDAMNITLGLKYLRVSPDHGTAVSIIKKESKPY